MPTDTPTRPIPELVERLRKESKWWDDAPAAVIVPVNAAKKLCKFFNEAADALTRPQAENEAVLERNRALHRRLQGLESPRRVGALSAPITMQDIRLCAGEGRLSAATVLQAANELRATRLHGGDHEPS